MVTLGSDESLELPLSTDEGEMLKGDQVKFLFWDAVPTLNNVIGEIVDWKEVGKKLENVDYEYLVKFGDGHTIWVPSRYLTQRL